MNNPYLLFKNIKAARIQAGMSQKQLANKLGLSDKTVSAYETGRAIPPTIVLFSIAKATGRSLLQLTGFEQKTTENTISNKLDTLAEKIFEIGDQIKKSMDIFVGIVLLDDNNSIYLIKEDDKNKIGKNRWNLPGGSVDAGESLIKAAVRETGEETGYESDVASLLGCYKCKKGDKNWIYIVFSARTDGLHRHKISKKEKDIKDGKWFTKKEFLKLAPAEMVHPDMLIVYNIATNNQGLSTESIKYIDYDLE